MMFNPPSPGEIIKQVCLDPLGITITAAAKGLGVSRKTLSDLIHGRTRITPEMAYRLSMAFNTTQESWILQQAQYDERIHKDEWEQLHVEPLFAVG